MSGRWNGLRKWHGLFLFAILIACLIVPGLDVRLNVVRYAVDAGLPNAVRLALVTDLHSCAYGEGQRELIDAIDAEAPDAILLCGDIYDDDAPDDNTNAFILGVCERYPVYYVTGNHEYRRGTPRFKEAMAFVKEHVTRLNDSAAQLTVGAAAVTIAGVNDPAAYTTKEIKLDGALVTYEEKLAHVAKVTEGSAFTVLLAHRPEHIDLYRKYGFDLILSGHTHGGQWRIPGLVNGLFAPNQGLFPAYAGGLYAFDDATLIVSRGLARETTRLPRFYNRPELVIVDLK